MSSRLLLLPLADGLVLFDRLLGDTHAVDAGRATPLLHAAQEAQAWRLQTQALGLLSLCDAWTAALPEAAAAILRRWDDDRVAAA